MSSIFVGRLVEGSVQERVSFLLSQMDSDVRQNGKKFARVWRDEVKKLFGEADDTFDIVPYELRYTVRDAVRGKSAGATLLAECYASVYLEWLGTTGQLGATDWLGHIAYMLGLSDDFGQLPVQKLCRPGTVSDAKRYSHLFSLAKVADGYRPAQKLVYCDGKSLFATDGFRIMRLANAHTCTFPKGSFVMNGKAGPVPVPEGEAWTDFWEGPAMRIHSQYVGTEWAEYVGQPVKNYPYLHADTVGAMIGGLKAIRSVYRFVRSVSKQFRAPMPRIIDDLAGGDCVRFGDAQLNGGYLLSVLEFARDVMTREDGHVCVEVCTVGDDRSPVVFRIGDGLGDAIVMPIRGWEVEVNVPVLWNGR